MANVAGFCTCVLEWKWWEWGKEDWRQFCGRCLKDAQKGTKRGIRHLKNLGEASPRGNFLRPYTILITWFYKYEKSLRTKHEDSVFFVKTKRWWNEASEPTHITTHITFGFLLMVLRVSVGTNCTSDLQINPIYCIMSVFTIQLTISKPFSQVERIRVDNSLHLYQGRWHGEQAAAKMLGTLSAESMGSRWKRNASLILFSWWCTNEGASRAV
jgi:hypothetical protein